MCESSTEWSFKMVAVEEKISEQILAPEPLFYYKEFSLRQKI
jgi:hypothetical protein